ncbi:MAG: four helix bundle protein [Candidatus Campbellbacteria bacterium]|nr:four helix bundle protein [Candidatus Campbellbacteria bacterium]
MPVKAQNPKHKAQKMTNEVQQEKKIFDLEERSRTFAMNVRHFTSTLQKTQANIEDGKQLVRSSGSVGANYIEANECLSRKDFVFRIRICRKESRESSYWLSLISINTEELEGVRKRLYRESLELARIFSTIMWNTEAKIKSSK